MPSSMETASAAHCGQPRAGTGEGGGRAPGWRRVARTLSS